MIVISILLGTSVLLISSVITVDCHNRNKYATPWFLLSVLTGVIGALFYYVNIRTEDDAESLPSPSGTVRVLSTLLSVVGPAFIMLSILAIIGDTTGMATYLLGFPAIAVGHYLTTELSIQELKTQRLLAEGTSILIFGFFFPLMLLTMTYDSPDNWLLLLPILICIGLFAGWLQVREVINLGILKYTLNN